MLLVCGTSQASQWVSVSKGEGGKTETLVDASSIRIAGNVRRAWVKFVFAPHTERGNSSYADKWVSFFLTRTAFNCSQETARDEAQNAYFENGTSASVPASNYPEPWQPVAPDSSGSHQMQFICAWNPK